MISNSFMRALSIRSFFNIKITNAMKIIGIMNNVTNDGLL